MDREAGSVWLRDLDGKRVTYPRALSDSESVLSQIREPHLYPDLAVLREEMRSWRFYHHFRTDADSPMRYPRGGVRTPVLSHDGKDLAAALQTIREIGDRLTLEESIEAAFPGAEMETQPPHEAPGFCVSLTSPGVHRPMTAQELSDGTLRFLCLLAALLSPRPPGLIALNEPETSLYPDLFGPLAKLLTEAGRNSQIWLTTHSDSLAEMIGEYSGTPPIRLEMVEGETRACGRGLLGRAAEE
jgi:predicted ATPase